MTGELSSASSEASRPPGVYPLFDERAPWAEIEESIDWEVVPFFLGPVWDRRESWGGPRDPEGYILPEFTLGYQVIQWVRQNLLSDEVDAFDRPLPFVLTSEQARFVLWFYAIDESGRFLYREVVLQRLKGHGKDPLASVIAAVEFVGPCRFAGWAARDFPELGVVRGEPVAKAHPRAWIQVAAVSLTQTQNTMNLFQGLFSQECKDRYLIDVHKEVVYALAGQKRIQAVTSSPRTLEGNRPTLVIMNEPHQWVTSNDGKAMRDAIERNAAKAKGGAARLLAITNAYEPSEDSVGRDMREAYETRVATGWANRMMYDTLEAPKAARLRPAFPDESPDAARNGVEPIPAAVKERLTRRYLRRVIEAVRGGAWWLDVDSLIESILDPQNKPSRSRRFWFNQVWGSEDSWLGPDAISASVRPDVAELRLGVTEPKLILEAGWLPVGKADPIVMFFDGSKSDDATALVGCRLSDGYSFLLGVWAKPQGEEGKNWLAPRQAVSRRVQQVFDRFNVVAFWGDPSHAKDGEGTERESSYWGPTLDVWMQRYRVRLDPRYWPVKSGLQAHAIIWDMTSADRTKVFLRAAEQVVADLENLNDVEEVEPLFRTCGHPVLLQHMRNAVSHPDPRGWGVGLAKVQKDSPRKIDAAVCLVGAQMLRRIVLNGMPEEEEDGAGELW